MKLNLQIKDNKIEIIKDVIKYSEYDLYLKAFANIDCFYNTLFHLIYNPQNLLFSTQKIEYESNVTLYTDNQDTTYKKYENIYKILCANIILDLYKWFKQHLEVDKIFIPNSLFSKEFDFLFDTDVISHRISWTLQRANQYIYTVAVLKLFEEKIKNTRQKKEYKDTIKKVLQIYVEESQIENHNWKQLCRDYVKEDYYLPIGELFKFLSLFCGR